MGDLADLIEFRAALREGIPAALRYLNARTPHRFTGIFRYHFDRLENLFLVDRENPTASPWPEFAARESYCAVMRDTGEAFVVGNAPSDPRVIEHPARDQVISYCGVPLRSEDGRLVASLCHFDYKPILFSNLDLEFLAEVAPLLVAAIADTTA